MTCWPQGWPTAVALVLIVLSGCGQPAGRGTLVYGPNAVVCDEAEAHSDLVWSVQRGVHDRADGSKAPTVDPRVVIAVLAPSQATWFAQWRADTRQTLALATTMETALAAAPPGQAQQMRWSYVGPVHASDRTSQMLDVPGGQWVWRGANGSSALWSMELVDNQQRPWCRVDMDVATARTLHNQLIEAASARPVRLGRVIDKGT